MDRLSQRLTRVVATAACVWFLTFLAASLPASAQFKIVGPAPFPPAVARQKIRTLLEKANPDNTQQTVDTISGMLAWYRDIFDDELIAAWKKDTRANLPPVIQSLSDLRLATAVVEFSWHQAREATFNLTYAPMLGDLMARYAGSAKPFLDDLLVPASSGQPMPELSPPVAEAVCRILVDMPDIDAWKNTALKILPYYRRAAESLLTQDMHGNDQEKSYRAQRWLADIGSKMPGPAASDRPSEKPSPRRVLVLPFSGAKSGTLECTGGPIPQNGEFVFNLPLVNLLLDYDTKNWDARLAPGDGQTQRLILTNKSSSPQKRCKVRWSIAQ
jgi:hypothetical protein